MSTDTTNQEGVSAEENKKELPQRSTEKDQLENEIARQQREARDQQPEMEPEVIEPETLPEASTEELVGEVDETQAEDVNQVEMMTLKIGGIETQVEKDKILDVGVRSMQKQMNADKELQEVKELKKQLEVDRQELDKLKADREKIDKFIDETPLVIENNNQSATLSDEDFQSITHQIRYGDDEESVKALKKLSESIGVQQTTIGITEDAVKKIIRQNEDDRNFESAVERIKLPKEQGGFSELFDGGMLEAALKAQDLALSKQHPEMEYYDRMKKACEDVRNTFNPQNPTQKKTPKNDVNKQHLGNSPTSVSTAPVDQGFTPPESAEDRFNRKFANDQKWRHGR